jgi:phage tail-like protein
MDVNSSAYFLLKTEEEFDNGSSRLHWHDEKKCLMLAPNQAVRFSEATPEHALTEWQHSTPFTVDRFGQTAQLTENKMGIECYSGLQYRPLKTEFMADVLAPTGKFTDLHLSTNGDLSAPYTNGSDQHGLWVMNLRSRIPYSCSVSEAPLRTCQQADSVHWCVSQTKLMRFQGKPLPLPYSPLDNRFEPDPINPHALAQDFEISLPSPWQPLALCCIENRIIVLAHDGNGVQSLLSLNDQLSDENQFNILLMDDEAPFLVDIQPINDTELIGLCAQATDDPQRINRDCPKLKPNFTDNTVAIVYQRYPLHSLAVPRWVSSGDGQIRYQALPDIDYTEHSIRPRELHELKRPNYVLEASAQLREVLDSRQQNTVWHRIYVEAHVPKGCKVTLSVRVYNQSEDKGKTEFINLPPLVEIKGQTDLPFHQTNHAQQTQTFETLIQNSQGAVRRLAGRYLQLKIDLQGNGRHTPAVSGVRVYFPRFSYQEAYFPAYLKQEIQPNNENSLQRANAADTRERLLANFEGMLTPIESMIASSEQLIHPDATPNHYLPMVAQLLGSALPKAWPEHRQRRYLKCIGKIQQNKGTLASLNLMLDVVTDGGVQRGEVVVVENFRLRRTMATILGRLIDDHTHPLTLGTGNSGNSLVGDSLILSDMNAHELLALFAPEVADLAEQEAVKTFFEQYAHRISIVVNGNGKQFVTAIEDVMQEHLPAHLEWKLILTEHPFILGTSPLLNIDTFIEKQPKSTPVQLDKTTIGLVNTLQNPAAFSPRDINASRGSA